MTEMGYSPRVSSGLGAAALLAAWLLTGTRRSNEAPFWESFEACGAELGVLPGHNSFLISLSAPRRRFKRAAELLAEVLREPRFGLAVEQHRLDCVEKLLESRLLADAKLDELDADLAALERDIPRVHQQAMYSEAVYGQDIIAGLEEGCLFEYRTGAFAPYRWIFPQWWYHTAQDKKTMLQIYLLPDLTHLKMDSVNKGLPFSSMLLPALEQCGNRFYALTARARGMRALIRAEKYRRKHGSFPKSLPDLPEDPFTGKPLVYEVGRAEIPECVWKKTVDEATTERRTADVVQVHSDTETTIRLKVRYPDSADDPTRAMIRY